MLVASYMVQAVIQNNPQTNDLISQPAKFIGKYARGGGQSRTSWNKDGDKRNGKQLSDFVNVNHELNAEPSRNTAQSFISSGRNAQSFISNNRNVQPSRSSDRLAQSSRTSNRIAQPSKTSNRIAQSSRTSNRNAQPSRSTNRRSGNTNTNNGYKTHWEVKHQPENNYYGQDETSSGGEVRGEYYVLQPSGRLMRVTYTASASAGFQPRITYENNYTPQW